MEFTADTEGLASLIEFLRTFDKEIAKEVNDELRTVAKQVKDRVVQEAEAQGFTPPGRSGRGKGALIREIGYGVSRGKMYIRETANRKGFRYPMVYEFGKREEWMKRPFIKPGIDASQDIVQKGMEAALDRAAEYFNKE